MPFQKLRNLELENERLVAEIAALRIERDEWERKAVEISHMLTYTSEKLNHNGLSLIKKDTI